MTVEDLIYDQFPFVQCLLECGVGWHELIYKMCVEINAYYTDIYGANWTNLDDEDSFKFTQIKEKFAELRAYHNSCDVNLDNIVEKYRDISSHTCEICGAEGKLLRDEYWIKVRCEECRI